MSRVSVSILQRIDDIFAKKIRYSILKFQNINLSLLVYYILGLFKVFMKMVK